MVAALSLPPSLWHNLPPACQVPPLQYLAPYALCNTRQKQLAANKVCSLSCDPCTPASQLQESYVPPQCRPCTLIQV
ncbi:hypothetical protein FR483_n478L [Paramecium bursaria Chlorella virus FR483]|uniref:Uncharacterized protein n478L n=1 Tax=Paramecium bursaria Chlorella virus FR483 TaxID=399781 RepID=A7J7I2_PBCVF|nr:hypothetical protein FR483_n478L [Paramecium bursaria Chlorella virus FR483]ABT15763.1 hypothetical protein FR483_n478L [Paramecium bursaria Chlorella virus FR483]